MSMSVISSVAAAVRQAQPQQAAPVSTTTPPASASASMQNDTVTLSPAAQKTSQSGDVDHDGDSH
jgi:hypothetical protein